MNDQQTVALMAAVIYASTYEHPTSEPDANKAIRIACVSEARELFAEVHLTMPPQHLTEAP